MDSILRITEKNGAFRAFVADTTQLVGQASSVHGLSPVAAAALGRTLTANSIMGLDLKSFDETVSIQICADGPLGYIVTVGDNDGNVRGYLDNPIVDLPLKNGKLDVSGAVGQGTLTVVHNMGMRDPYVGRVKIQTGEIAQDIAYYYMISQQTPSVVALGVLVDVDYSIKAAGGYMIQLLPGAGDDVISKLEANVYTLETVTEMLTNNLDVYGIAKRLLLGFDYDILQSYSPQYKCNCSVDRMERALISLGSQQLQSIIDEDGKAELSCQFCKRKFLFDKSHLINLLESAKGV